MSQNPDAPDDATGLAHLVGEFIFWFAIVLVTVRCGRWWWLFFQGIVILTNGILGLITPHFTHNTIMTSLVGDFDDYHNFSIRVFSLVYLIYGLALLYYLTSTDDRAVSALMEGLLVGHAVDIVCHVILWARKPTGKPAHYPEKAIPFFSALILGNFLHLTVGQTGYNEVRNHQSNNLNTRIDAFASFIIAGIVLAFPTDILTLMTNKTEFDTAHIGAMKATGSFILCGAVISLQAEVFTREARRKLYLCRIFESLCFIALILGYLFFSDILTMTSLWAVSMYSVLAGNAFVAMKKLPIKSKE